MKTPILAHASPTTLAGIIADIENLGIGADQELIAIRAGCKRILKDTVGEAETARLLEQAPTDDGGVDDDSAGNSFLRAAASQAMGQAESFVSDLRDVHRLACQLNENAVELLIRDLLKDARRISARLAEIKTCLE